MSKAEQIPAVAPRVAHAIFTLERTFAASPRRVFAAWSTPAGKAAWFGGPADQWTPTERQFDFRVGGVETAVGKWNSGVVSSFRAVYQDILSDQRIVYAYSMKLDDRPISASLATVEFRAHGEGTQLIVTEQGAFLDGYADDGSREQGTAFLLDRLQAALAEGVLN
ncbi:MAG: SRPBCC family protein [Caulobacteraceae bacterium]